MLSSHKLIALLAVPAMYAAAVVFIWWLHWRESQRRMREWHEEARRNRIAGSSEDTHRIGRGRL